MNSVPEVRAFVDSALPRVAFYFESTLGLPFEIFKEEVERMNLLQQFVLCKKYG